LRKNSRTGLATETGEGAGESAEEEGKKEGAGAPADKFSVVGGRIGGEGIGDSGKKCAWNTVEEAPESTGEKRRRKGGENGDEESDGGVGEK
jgi:hypothetical protein